MFSSRIIFALVTVTICNFQAKRFTFALPTEDIADSEFVRCLETIKLDDETLENILDAQPIKDTPENKVDIILQTNA